MRLIGITGGVGAGKSTVLDILKEECNCEILLADRVAEELMQLGQTAYGPIMELPWPGPVTDTEGIIDRPLFAKYMFADESLRIAVDNIVHPAVWNEVIKRVENARKIAKIDYFFFEAALLIEAGYDKICDEIWYIFADENTRRLRLKASRGYSDEKIDSIFGCQLSDEVFRAKCTRIIDNSFSAEVTRRNVCQVLTKMT